MIRQENTINGFKDSLVKNIKRSNLGENKKTNYIYIIFVSIIIIITMLLKFLTINERKSDNKYEYIKNTLLENKDVLTTYLIQNFGTLKEYRVIALFESDDMILRVVLNEPIKTTENKLGYEQSNWIDVVVVVENGKIEFKDHKPIIIKREDREISAASIDKPIVMVEIDKSTLVNASH